MGFLNVVKNAINNIIKKPSITTEIEKPVNFSQDVFSWVNTWIWNITTGAWTIQQMPNFDISPISTTIEEDNKPEWIVLNSVADSLAAKSIWWFFWKDRENFRSRVKDRAVPVVKNMIEWIWDFWKQMYLWQQSKKIESITASVLMWWANITKSKWYIDTIISTFKTRNSSWNNNIEQLKKDLIETWIKKRYVNNITEDSIKNAQSALWLYTEKENELELLQIESSINSYANVFDNVLKIPNYNITPDEWIAIWKTLDSMSWDILDVDVFKQQLSKQWVSKNVINSISVDNIDDIKSKYEIKKDDTKIYKIDDIGFHQIRWDYDNIYNKNWELISQQPKNTTEYDEWIAWKYWVIDFDYGEYFNNAVKKASEKHPDATTNEIVAIASNATQQMMLELQWPKEDAMSVIRMIETERVNWNDFLANMLEEKYLKPINKVISDYQRNMLEVSDYILENDLVWVRDINQYLKKDKWMNTFNYLRRDSKWEIINTKWQSIPKYISDLAVDANTYWSNNTKTLSSIQKEYNLLTNTLSEWTSLLNRFITTVKRLWRWWAFTADSHRLWLIDPIPWFQAWEMWRESTYRMRWISDEFIALFPEVVVELAASAVTFWWVWSAWLLSVLWKASAAKKVMDTTNRVTKAIRYLNWVTKTFEAKNAAWELNKMWMIKSAIVNWAVKFLPDLYREWAIRLVDTDREAEWNTNLWIVSFLFPYIFEIRWLRSAMWYNAIWKSNVDMLNLIRNWDRTSREELNQLRKESINTITDRLKQAGKFDTKTQQTLKQWIAASAIAKMWIEKEWNRLVKSTENQYTFLDFWEMIMKDPAGFIKSMWKYLKSVPDEELKTIANELTNLVLDKNTNVADVIKYVYNIPWEVVFGGVKSTIWDTKMASKTLTDSIRQAAKNWEIVPFKFVGVWDWTMDVAAKEVFWKSFLPSKKFSKKEIDVAAEKAKWTNISWLFTKSWDDYAMFENVWGKYRLNDDWLRQLWIIDSPTTEKIYRQVDDEDWIWLKETMDKILWRDSSSLFWEQWLIPKVKELLSSKVC